MTHDQVFQAADVAVRSIKSAQPESVWQNFAAALGRSADYDKLSDKDIRSLTSKTLWAHEAVCKTVSRIGRLAQRCGCFRG
jgi:hypothetical protein